METRRKTLGEVSKYRINQNQSDLLGSCGLGDKIIKSMIHVCVSDIPVWELNILKAFVKARSQIR